MTIIDILLQNSNSQDKVVAITSIIENYGIKLKHNYLRNAFNNIAYQLSNVLYQCMYPTKTATRDTSYQYSICHFVLQETLTNYKEIFVALVHGFNDNFTIKEMRNLVIVDIAGDTSKFMLGYNHSVPPDYKLCPYCKLSSYHNFETLGLRISMTHECLIDSFKMERKKLSY